MKEKLLAALGPKPTIEGRKVAAKIRSREHIGMWFLPYEVIQDWSALAGPAFHDGQGGVTVFEPEGKSNGQEKL